MNQKSPKKQLTSESLLKRGYCCQTGCENCPFGFKQIDPTIPLELQLYDDKEDHFFYQEDYQNGDYE